MSRLISRLHNAWAEWRDAVPNPRLRKPTVLQFPVNDICNSRCQMCRIWERKRDEEISPEELIKVLSDPLFSEVQSVGMNGGEPTLRPDLERLAEVLIDKLPRLKSLSLITNAIREKRVIGAIERLGRVCRKHGKHLDVMVSLDGVGEVHDRVRGVPGNFDAAMSVLDFLKTSEAADSYRIGCTIIAENVFDVENVLALAKERGVYARFRLGVPHPRLYSAGLTEPFSLSEEQVFHVAAFLDGLIQDYEKEEGRRAFYTSLRDQITEGRPRMAGCAWKSHGATLGPRGELSYCAVASPVLGNARTTGASGLYWGGAEILDEIQRDKCATCRHDYEGVALRRVLVKRWARRSVSAFPVPVVNLLRSGWHGASDRKKYMLRGSGSVQPLCVVGPRPRLLLAGWYGTETLGDKAILGGLCSILQEVYPGAEVDVVSLQPYVTRETIRLMPELGISRVLDMTSAAEAVAQGSYSGVGMAGGPLMSTIRETIDVARLFALARRVGARTAILGCGLGPIKAAGPRFAAIREMIRTADVCILRDKASALAANALGRRGEMSHGLDPAWFWSPLASVKKPTGMLKPVRIAMALRDWPLDEYARDLGNNEGRIIKEKFEAELIRFVDTISTVSPQAELMPICMHTLPVGGDDRLFYRRVFANHPKIISAVSWRRRNPADELELFQRADAVLAMRFHANVFALALGKPMLGLDYTRGGKIGALMNETGNAERLVELDSFDGMSAAYRLVAECDGGTGPRMPDKSSSYQLYASAMRAWLTV